MPVRPALTRRNQVEPRAERPPAVRMRPIRQLDLSSAIGAARASGPVPFPDESLGQPAPRPRGSEHPVSSAYKVFDRYLDEGRQYAAGHSAWSQSLSRSPAAPTPGAVPGDLLGQWDKLLSAIDALRVNPAAAALAPWFELLTKLLPTIGSELRQTISPPAPRASTAPPHEDWERWFQEHSTPGAHKHRSHPSQAADRHGASVARPTPRTGSTIPIANLKPAREMPGSGLKENTPSLLDDVFARGVSKRNL